MVGSGRAPSWLGVPGYSTSLDAAPLGPASRAIIAPHPSAVASDLTPAFDSRGIHALVRLVGARICRPLHRRGETRSGGGGRSLAHASAFCRLVNLSTHRADDEIRRPA